MQDINWSQSHGSQRYLYNRATILTAMTEMTPKFTSRAILTYFQALRFFGGYLRTPNQIHFLVDQLEKLTFWDKNCHIFLSCFYEKLLSYRRCLKASKENIHPSKLEISSWIRIQNPNCQIAG